MRTKIVEAVQSKEAPGNWGKFLVAAFDEEWAYESRVDPDGGPAAEGVRVVGTGAPVGA